MNPIGYHEIKTNMCKEIRLYLIHIWETDWKNNKKYIKTQIK